MKGAVTLYSFKPRFQALLRPVVAWLAQAGVTANQITVAAAAGSVAVGTFIFISAPERWPFLLLPAWLLIRMALNAIDGMLAREWGQRSVLGAYLNELGDVTSDTALYIPFVFVSPFPPLWTRLVVLLSALSEFAGVMGPSVGASRRYDGPMGKSDRALLFGALGLYVGLGGPLPDWSAYLMPAVAGLVGLTIVNRVRAGIAEAARPKIPDP